MAVQSQIWFKAFFSYNSFFLCNFFLFCNSSLPCAFDSEVTYPRGSYDFAFWRRKHVVSSFAFLPPNTLSSLPHCDYSLWFFPNPSTDRCLVKRWAMENFIVILMGTSLVTFYKTLIIYLHIRAALVLKVPFSVHFCPGVPLGKRRGLRASAARRPLCVLSIKP